jgi:hypothetical protein
MRGADQQLSAFQNHRAPFTSRWSGFRHVPLQKHLVSQDKFRLRRT